MSALIMGLVWEEPIAFGFGGQEKYVLLAYADHADQNGASIYPSIELIAQKTGYSERSVQRYTRTLEELGFLVPDGQGRNGTNRWRIPIARSQGGAKLSPVPLVSPERMSPEELSPEPSVEVKDSTTTTTGGGEIFKIYETEIGTLTPLISDAIQDAEKTYPAQWLPAAIHEAALNNKRNWKYCEAILKRWQIEGFKSTRPVKGSVKGTAGPSSKFFKGVKPSNQDIIRKVAEHV